MHIDPNIEIIKNIVNLFKSNKVNLAKDEIDKYLQSFPNSPVLYNILGSILLQNKEYNEAVKNIKKSLILNPSYAQAYNNLGIAYQKIGKLNLSIENYKKAIDLNQSFAEPHNNLANVLLKLNYIEESISHFEKAINVRTNYAEAFNGLGACFEKKKDKQKAFLNYKKSIELNPLYDDAYLNIGNLYIQDNQYENAIKSYEKAIELNPNYAKSYNNLGNLFNFSGNFQESMRAYQKAISIKPNYSSAHSNLLFNYIFKTDFKIEEYLSIANDFAQKNFPKNFRKINYKFDKNVKKLKLGFVSSDFGNHPGGYFSYNLIKELNKKGYELYAYVTYNRDDSLSYDFQKLFNKWNIIENKKDIEVAEEIANEGIHILFDIQGHSAKNRLPIFFFKPAPIQVTWIGQGSTGINEIDYFIGNEFITPKKDELHYTEKIVRIPKISQTFKNPPELTINNIPALKNNFITFGSLNQIPKINYDVINTWSQILKNIKESKILIKNRLVDSLYIKKEILKKFNDHGINENQIILEGSESSREDLLKTYNKIDISLDTFPFQGNTTTIESMWMGVPVLTLKGDRHISYFGECINSNCNMNDWISSDKEEYIKKAIKFSNDLNLISNIRKNLRNTILKSPIFDHETLGENFDKLIKNIWLKYLKK